MFMQNNNPFQQKPYNWLVTGVVNSIIQNDVQNYFENISDVASIFEIEENIYELSVYFDYKPDIKMFESQLADIFCIDVVKTINLELVWVEEKDWVCEVQKKFIPINSGQFYIYNSFNDDIKDANTDLIKIKIDPGRAFGTGEHETTKLCLRAISELDIVPTEVMDLGCGSAILAIAVQKKFKTANVIAVDIDDVAIEVAKLNCEQNECTNIVSKYSENIFADPKDTAKKYDLLIANILANPLIIMAQDIVNAVVDGGKIILSGFLESQEKELLDVYLSHGCKIHSRFNDNNWLSIILEV